MAKDYGSRCGRWAQAQVRLRYRFASQFPVHGRPRAPIRL